ncbi:IS5 family transposase [Xanthomonas arboricola]
MPDETTILNFRRLLEKHDLVRKLFNQINAYLGRKKLSLRGSTIVDATIITAPSSTKNQEGEHDPEMHQTKKGNNWHFGMKAHIGGGGGDAESGLVHHVEDMAANVVDISIAHELLHGDGHFVSGDSGYTGLDKREQIRQVTAICMGAEKPSVSKKIRGRRKYRSTVKHEWLKAGIRAQVEHPFWINKRQFGYVKVRYRGLVKNTAQLFMLFAWSNVDDAKAFAAHDGTDVPVS